MPSPLLIEDLDLLEDECSHSSASSAADSTGDGSKVRTVFNGGYFDVYL